MNLKLLLSSFILLLAIHANSADYYVRMDGNDANPGTANIPEEAWQTMDHALSKLVAGDQLFVDDGIYVTRQLRVENIQGSPDKITLIKAINRWKAVLTQETVPESDSAVLTVTNSSYIHIDGFEVVDSIDTGIGITVRNSSHHVTISNCYVHDCGCNGISSRKSDYVIIEDNVVRGNSRRNIWNCSGISIWHPIELDRKPGYHIIIRRNVAFENECDLPFTPLGHDNPTDGNGIIIDDFRNTQGGGQEGGYISAVLVENNLCFNNGGRGFNVYQADNVTLRNNTSYHNLRIIEKYADFPGEMTLANSTGCKLFNNLVVKDPEVRTKALRSYDNDGLNTKIHNNLVIGPVDYCGQEIYDKDNMIFDVSKQEKAGFKNASKAVDFRSIEDFRNYFGLVKKSEAREHGSSKDSPNEDRDGMPRPVKGGIDAGCYEWQKSAN